MSYNYTDENYLLLSHSNGNCRLQSFKADKYLEYLNELLLLILAANSDSTPMNIPHMVLNQVLILKADLKEFFFCINFMRNLSNVT